jgi:pimeloyl-ACP methyl ester carboxylesterase
VLSPEPSMELKPPPRLAMWREARVVFDLAQMLSALVSRKPRRERVAASRPIVILPGFGANDALMLPLRRHLSSHGFHVEGWGLGVNRAGLDQPHTLDDISAGWNLSPLQQYRREAGVALLCDRMVSRAHQRSLALGQPLTLIGWSLGGTIAREVARDLPDHVAQVITLGSPVIGGPKYTATARALRAKGLDLDWIEEHVRRRESRPIRQPITSIVSRSDGIVGWSAAQDHFSPKVRHVEVAGSHLGMAFSPAVWQLVLDAIDSGH